jgi:N-methylhydantoinase A
VHQERSLTRIMSLDETEPATLEALFRDMEQEAIADLEREQFCRSTISVLRHAGMRYRGQSYEVSVPVQEIASEKDVRRLVEAFHAAHERRYGHKAVDERVEIVNFKVTAVGAIPRPRLHKAEVDPIAHAIPIETRITWFNEADAVPTPVFRRSQLRAGTKLLGPAVIEEKTSTIVLYPGQRARIDEWLNLEIECDPRD